MRATEALFLANPEHRISSDVNTMISHIDHLNTTTRQAIIAARKSNKGNRSMNNDLFEHISHS